MIAAPVARGFWRSADFGLGDGPGPDLPRARAHPRRKSGSHSVGLDRRDAASAGDLVPGAPHAMAL